MVEKSSDILYVVLFLCWTLSWFDDMVKACGRTKCDIWVSFVLMLWQLLWNGLTNEAEMASATYGGLICNGSRLVATLQRVMSCVSEKDMNTWFVS